MSGARAIDVPIETLPAVDEHAIDVAAPPDVVWEALFPVLERSFAGRTSATLARALGCVETESDGDLRHPGGTLPGFVVARAVPAGLLALLGGHRFSRYALIFHIDAEPDGSSRLRAETRAIFPGVSGRIYRTLVIGSRGHVLAVRRILRAVRRRAQHADVEPRRAEV